MEHAVHNTCRYVARHPEAPPEKLTNRIKSVIRRRARQLSARRSRELPFGLTLDMEALLAGELEAEKRVFANELLSRMSPFARAIVNRRASGYPQYIEQVKPELNGLFREEDYPSAEKLRKKFGVKLEVLPIPSGADFRVQMSAEEQARVSREIDANVRESLMRGTEDLWKRLREVVAHMVDRLNEPESRFHGSLVTNVLDLVEILPRLNVNGDADLNRFAEQVKERLCNYSAQDLKKHDLLRVTTAADAANIVAEMDGLMRSREAALPAETPSADEIFNRMSAYMEAPAAA